MISIPMIRRKLASDLLGRHIYLFGPASSATEVLRRLADAGAREGTVVLTEDEGRSFHVSALFRPDLPLPAVPLFSSIAALALTEAIASEGLRAAAAWPNEVLVAGNRVGQSLAVVAPAAGRAAYMMLGAEVDLRALSEVEGRPIDPNAVAAAFLNGLDRWSTEYAVGGPAALVDVIRLRQREPAAPDMEEQRAR